MSEYTREMIGNCRRWIKDLTDDSVNETLCADEFAGLLDDALDEIERQQARIAELEGEIAKMKKYFHKPAHGTCCTCQKCGHIYDECRCDFDETYDENDILTARNAELEAFVNRLIEAGNTIVFETFEGYKKHGLFDFAPVNTWQVLVKDWLAKEREK